ncbi:MAG: adenylate/guanylate cyclase domain-containing protein [Thermodesulfobacteriota bacterium]|nr:adenylate/guanylate cyclase domain-containing protein [Thermodesulfobacteriota bacterium]
MEEKSAQHSRILVVDDNIQNVELLDAYLGVAGYEVIKAYNGEEALEMVKKENPHLILLDIMMPKLNGYEVCRILKDDEKTRFTPIVMITALTELEDKIKGLEIGADDFLTKPFNKVELLTRVKSLLRLKYLRDELDRRKEEEKERMKEIFKTYMSDEIADLVLSDPERFLRLGGEKRVVTVMFADLRGFTQLAERYPAEKVVNMLNQYFQEMTRVIFKYNGTFDKFMGDAIMAYFGAPVSHQDDVLMSLTAVIEMQRSFDSLSEIWKRDESIDLGLGLGLSTGEVIFGNVGSEKVMNYTIIGDTVNIAQRLEEKALRGQILISDYTYQRVKDRVLVEKLPPKSLKGKKAPLMSYVLKGII